MKVWLALAAAFVAAQAWTATPLIVELPAGVDPQAIADRYGIQLVDRTDPAPFFLYLVGDGQDYHAIQLAMQQDPQVVWAEDDAEFVMPEHIGAGKGSTIGVVGDRNDLYGFNQGIFDQIRWDRSLAEGPGRTVRLAILDTGLSPNHPQLWLKTVASLNLVEPGQPAYDLPTGSDTNGNGTLDEGIGHGTMVAGIVDQVAPRVPLIVARVADSDGIATGWRLIKGLAFAVVSNAEVVNVSLGANDRIPALSNVMDWVEAHRVLVVASIGNNALRMATHPAGISKVVCVSGVDPFDVKATFSNWEGTADVAAPATGVRSTWWDGTLGVWSGTSFASPFAAAAIADCARRRRNLPLEVLRAAFDRGDDIDGQNPNYEGQLGPRLNHVRLDAALPRRIVLQSTTPR